MVYRQIRQRQASEKARKVLSLLRSRDPNDLPFEFSDRHSDRLVGKQRVRVGDSAETLAARQGYSLVPEMLKALYEGGDCAFERLCAALMLLSGAKEAFAGCTNDDGGIDIYGRIQLRLSDEYVRSGILQTAILQKSLLLLGQCKCHQPEKLIEPSDLREFSGAVNDCLNQYEGNHQPPSHRVPPSYYRRGETCIPVFFTTASFSDRASAVARSNDITLVDGKNVAQFLIYHRVAVATHVDGSVGIDAAALAPWTTAQLTALPASSPS